MNATPSSLWKTLKSVADLIWTGAPAYVKRRMGLALALVAVTSVITAVTPLVMKVVIDRLATPVSGPNISIVTLILLLALCHWLARLMGEVRTFFNMQGDRRMYRSLCNRLFDHVVQLPMRYHLKRQTGVMTETLTNGLQGYEMISHSLVMIVLPISVELVAVVVVFIGLGHVDFLAIFFIAMVCYGGAFRYGAKQIMERARSASTAQVNAWGMLTDILLNYETIKLFTAEPVVSQKFDAAGLRTEAEWQRFNWTRALVGTSVATIFAVFVAVTFYFAAQHVQTGVFTIGTFVLIGTYMFRLVQPLEQIGYAVQQMSQGCAYLEQLLAILAEVREPASAAGTGRVSGPGELEFRNVSFAYGPDRPTLRNVSFRALAGKTLGIVGASGSGKTSLLRLSVRLLEPDSGEIFLDGVPIVDIPLASLRQAIAVVPQDSVLFHDTIAYNIALGKPGSSLRDVEHAARLAHLHEFVMSLPEQYETKVGERGVQLSGGERQRVAIARAAIKRPIVYIFDEATSSLDSRTEREVLENLRDISTDSTTLIIAHRLSSVVHATEILVIDRGAIFERGSHGELIAQKGRYARLWEAQQGSHNRVLGMAANDIHA